MLSISLSYEMQEPRIANGGLTPDSTGGGGKVRSLTSQELSAISAAEEAVKKELQKQKGKKLPVQIESIEQELSMQNNNSKNIANMKQSIPFVAIQDAVRRNEPEKNFTMQLNTARDSQNVPSISENHFAQNSKLIDETPRRKPLRKLSSDEMQIVGKSLETLIKHRQVT